MKLTKEQLEVVRTVNAGIEMSEPIFLYEDEIVKAFPKLKKKFEKLCRLHEEFEELFSDLEWENQDVDDEEGDDE